MTVLVRDLSCTQPSEELWPCALLKRLCRWTGLETSNYVLCSVFLMYQFVAFVFSAPFSTERYRYALGKTSERLARPKPTSSSSLTERLG